MTTHPLAVTGKRLLSRVWTQSSQENDMLSQQTNHETEWIDYEEEFDEFESWETLPEPGAQAEPSLQRWGITFTVIAIVLSLAILIVFRGLTQSDWLYGTTYDQISEHQWAQITHLRDQLVRLDLAPKAVNALNDALVLPHPSIEAVLSDLRQAAQALDKYNTRASVRQIQAELYTLIGQIQPGPGSSPTPRPTLTSEPPPTLTPITDAPVVQSPN